MDTVPPVAVTLSAAPSMKSTFAELVSARSPPLAKIYVTGPSTKSSSSTTLEFLKVARLAPFSSQGGQTGVAQGGPMVYIAPRLTLIIRLHVARAVAPARTSIEATAATSGIVGLKSRW